MNRHLPARDRAQLAYQSLYDCQQTRIFQADLGSAIIEHPLSNADVDRQLSVWAIEGDLADTATLGVELWALIHQHSGKV